jgi:hypothetical protein
MGGDRALADDAAPSMAAHGTTAQRDDGGRRSPEGAPAGG